MATAKGFCSAIYFLNLRGEVLVYRAYRDDIGCARAAALGTVNPSAGGVRAALQRLERGGRPVSHAPRCSPAACASRQRRCPGRLQRRRAFRARLTGLALSRRDAPPRRRHMADAFRTQVLQNKDAATTPVVTLGSCSFLYTREARARASATCARSC
jgi:hypothetical protein